MAGFTTTESAAVAMAGFTITESAAFARTLLQASPLASREATATRGELAAQWLKITLVPLLVFLVGACLWRCIKKSPAWRMLTNDEGSTRNGGVHSARTVDGNNGSIDLEAGRELSHSVAVMTTAALTNVESTNEAAATDSTPTNDTTASDIGNGITGVCE